MRGSLGRLIPAANTETTLYTVTINCSYADVDIFILNPDGATDVTIKVGISSDNATLSANEYIENGTIVAKLGGTHEIISRKLSPGDTVVVASTLANTVFRIEGSEEVLY